LTSLIPWSVNLHKAMYVGMILPSFFIDHI
jgi:hypothetical protein